MIAKFTTHYIPEFGHMVGESFSTLGGYGEPRPLTAKFRSFDQTNIAFSLEDFQMFREH